MPPSSRDAENSGAVAPGWTAPRAGAVTAGAGFGPAARLAGRAAAAVSAIAAPRHATSASRGRASRRSGRRGRIEDPRFMSHLTGRPLIRRPGRTSFQGMKGRWPVLREGRGAGGARSRGRGKRSPGRRRGDEEGRRRLGPRDRSRRDRRDHGSARGPGRAIPLRGAVDRGEELLATGWNRRAQRGAIVVLRGDALHAAGSTDGAAGGAGGPGDDPTRDERDQKERDGSERDEAGTPQ